MGELTNKSTADFKLGDNQVTTVLLGDQRVWPLDSAFLSFDIPLPDPNFGQARGNTIRFSTLFDNWKAGMIIATSTELSKDEILEVNELTESEILEIRSIPERPFNTSINKRASIYASHKRPRKEGTRSLDINYSDLATLDRFDGNIWFDTRDSIYEPLVYRYNSNIGIFQSFNELSDIPTNSIVNDIAQEWVQATSTDGISLTGTIGRGLAYVSGGEMNDYLDQELSVIDVNSNLTVKGVPSFDWDEPTWPIGSTATYTDEELGANMYLKRVMLSGGWGCDLTAEDCVHLWYNTSLPATTTHKTNGEGYALYDYFYETSSQRLYQLTDWRPNSWNTDAQYNQKYTTTFDRHPSGEIRDNSFAKFFLADADGLDGEGFTGQWILPKPKSISDWNSLNYWEQSIAARTLDDKLITLIWTELTDEDLVNTFSLGISAINVPSDERIITSKTDYKLVFDVPVAAYTGLRQKKTFLGQNQISRAAGRMETDVLMADVCRVNKVPYNFSSAYNYVITGRASVPFVVPEKLNETIELANPASYTFESIKKIKIRDNKNFDAGLEKTNGRRGGYPEEYKRFPIGWPTGNGAPFAIKSPTGITASPYDRFDYHNPNVEQTIQDAFNKAWMYKHGKGYPSTTFTISNTGGNVANYQLRTLQDIPTHASGYEFPPYYLYKKIETWEGVYEGKFGESTNGVYYPPRTDRGSMKPVYNNGTLYQPGTKRNEPIDENQLVHTDICYKVGGAKLSDRFTEQYDAVQTRRLAYWFPTMDSDQLAIGSGGTVKEDSDTFPVAFGTPYKVWQERDLIPHLAQAVYQDNYNPMDREFPATNNNTSLDDLTIDLANGCRKVTTTLTLPDGSGNKVRGFIGHRIKESRWRAARYGNAELNLGAVGITYINRDPNPVNVSVTLNKPDGTSITRTGGIATNTYRPGRRPQFEFNGLPGGNYSYTVSDSKGNSANASLTIPSRDMLGYDPGGRPFNYFSWQNYTNPSYGSVSVSKTLPEPSVAAPGDINIKILPVDLNSLASFLPQYQDYYEQSSRGPLMYFYDHAFAYYTDPYSAGYSRPFFSFMIYDQGVKRYTPNSEVLLVFFPFSEEELTNGEFDKYRYQSYQKSRGTEYFNFNYQIPKYLGQEVIDAYNNSTASDYKRVYLAVEPEHKISSDAINADGTEASYYSTRSADSSLPLPPAIGTQCYGPIVCDYDGGYGTGLPRRRRNFAGGYLPVPNYTDSNGQTRNYQYYTYKNGSSLYYDSSSEVRATSEHPLKDTDAPMKSLWPTAIVLTTDGSGKIKGLKHNGTQPLDTNDRPSDFTGAMAFDYAGRAEWTEDPWFVVCQSLSAGIPQGLARSSRYGTVRPSTLYDPLFAQSVYPPVGGIYEKGIERLGGVEKSGRYWGSSTGDAYTIVHEFQNAYIFEGNSSTNYGYNLQAILDNQELPSNATRAAFISNTTVENFPEYLKNSSEAEVEQLGINDSLVGIEFEDFTSGRYPYYIDKESTSNTSGYVHNYYYGGGNTYPTQNFQSNRVKSLQGDTRLNLDPQAPSYRAPTMSWATQTDITNIEVKGLTKLLYIKDAPSTDVLNFPLHNQNVKATQGWKKACEGVLNQLTTESRITVTGCPRFKYAIPGSAQIFAETELTTVWSGTDFI